MECGDFIESPSEQQVGKARSSVCVERVPVFRRANDILSVHAGQALARIIPNQYLRIGADNVCRDNEVLHEANGEAMISFRGHPPDFLHLFKRAHENDIGREVIKGCSSRSTLGRRVARADAKTAFEIDESAEFASIA
jgi:hypothetical protein